MYLSVIKNKSMCYFKAGKQTRKEAKKRYGVSYDKVDNALNDIKAKFYTLLKKDDALQSIGLEQGTLLAQQLSAYSTKEGLPAHLSKEDVFTMRWYQRFLGAYDEEHNYTRYYENGFDYFPMPIVTAGEPDTFNLFHWGLVPFFQKEEAKAMKDRMHTLNCISEEMWEKPSFRAPIKNAQRCLIPVTGFFEWRWLDEKGTIKVPYYITFRDQQTRSMAGLYSRWKNPTTGEYYYSYTVLTCKANAIMEYVHNHKQRMPVFIDPSHEKDWLNRDLKKEDVMDLCTPYQDTSMRAYTISKMLTTRGIDHNTPEVIAPFNYTAAITLADEHLKRGDTKKALAVFKEQLSVSAEASKLGEGQLKAITQAGIRSELSLS
jgi:putative SOS response-associated peptidase YedK